MFEQSILCLMIKKMIIHKDDHFFLALRGPEGDPLGLQKFELEWYNIINSLVGGKEGIENNLG